MATHDLFDLRMVLPALSIVVDLPFAEAKGVEANVSHRVGVELVKSAEKVARGAAHNGSYQPVPRHLCKEPRLRSGRVGVPGQWHHIDTRQEAHTRVATICSRSDNE